MVEPHAGQLLLHRILAEPGREVGEIHTIHVVGRVGIEPTPRRLRIPSTEHGAYGCQQRRSRVAAAVYRADQKQHDRDNQEDMDERADRVAADQPSNRKIADLGHATGHAVRTASEWYVIYPFR